MSDTTSQSRKLKLGSMTVTITLEVDTYHVRARKATPLTDEDYIQLQILEPSSGITGFNLVTPPGRNKIRPNKESSGALTIASDSALF